jgi:outer membrane immunogenic protein
MAGCPDRLLSWLAVQSAGAKAILKDAIRSAGATAGWVSQQRFPLCGRFCVAKWSELPPKRVRLRSGVGATSIGDPVMLRTIALAATAVALMSGATFAADLAMPETPYLPESTGFSWDGLYAGVGIGGYLVADAETVAHVSGVVGVNAVIADPFLIGAELEANYMFENDDYYSWYEVWLKGRAGVLVTPDVLIYGVAGVGIWSYDTEDDNGTQYGLGLGIEAAVSDSISLRGEALAVPYDDGDVFDGVQAKASILFHF